MSRRKPLKVSEEYKAAMRKHAMQDAEFGTCKRCQRKWIPAWNDRIDCFDVFCSRCQVLNLADAFEADARR